MSFLLPMFGSLASGLIGKALHLKEGGVIHIKGKKRNGALAVVHDGEMVVPKKHVARVKKVMKEEHIIVPKSRSTKSLDAHKKEAHQMAQVVHKRVKAHISPKPHTSPKPRARRTKK